MSDSTAHDKRSWFIRDASRTVANAWAVLTGIPVKGKPAPGLVKVDGPYVVYVSSATHSERIRDKWRRLLKERTPGIISCVVLYSRWDDHVDDARVMVRFEDYCTLIQEHYEALRRAGRVNNERW